MAYVDGTLVVAGMSNEEFSSTLRRIPFPFTGEVSDNNLEIFHVSHGKWETAAPIRTFVPYDGGQQHPRELHVHAARALPARPT